MMTSKQTKIVATVSDKRCEIDFVRALYENGMNVVRMNSAHLNAEGFDRIINNVRAVSNTIAILMDTKGPEVRTTFIENDGSITFTAGDIVRMAGNPDAFTTHDAINVSYVDFAKDLSVDSVVLIDDGELEFRVLEKHDDYLLCVAQNAGELGSRKSVNVPGVRINLPALTEKDRRNILYAIDKDIDFIAHSFVRNRQDVLAIQEILDAHNSKIKIIAKIENQEGVDNIDEILEVAYGVMIARGDLGIEVPQEKIPGIQRRLIKKCVQAKKPVIVATQMLHSMIKNPRPTRAEVTDIANAIYYRTDALMLSGETAYGKYPVEAIATMSRIAKEAELTKLSDNDIQVNVEGEVIDTTSFLSKHAVESAKVLGVKAIVTDSFTGRTARNLAAYRGENPILAICYSERTMRQLALSYGVIAFYQHEMSTSREYLFHGLSSLVENGMITNEDLIAYIGGAFGEGSGSSFLEINKAGLVLKGYDRYILPNLEDVH
ncbi:pyruvate kinase [Bacteroides sp. CAG:144]|jgi:pyruvate kinase|nr:pyruvate kinase [Bacteroides sp. CAG:144]